MAWLPRQQLFGGILAACLLALPTAVMAEEQVVNSFLILWCRA
jgi:hypothetical protein